MPRYPIYSPIDDRINPRVPSAPQSTPLDPGSVDLQELASMLRSATRGLPLRTYLDGKTSLRNAVAHLLGCSLLQAETLVDVMESRRILRFTGDPQRSDQRPGAWTLHPNE